MCSSRGGHNGPIGGDGELSPSGPHPHPHLRKAATAPPAATTPAEGPGGPPPRADTAGQGEAAHRAASSIRRLGEAIDALAEAARVGEGGEAAPAELAGRLAGIWAMIADLDPAVAMRLRGYSPGQGE